MERLRKIPGAFVELTVGTVIVMYQLTIARRLTELADKRARKQLPN